MSLNTTLFDVKASFNTLLAGIVASIQTDLNATFGTDYMIDFSAQREDVTYPSVRVWWYSEAGINNRRFVSRVQIDVFTQAQPQNPDDRLPTLIKENILKGLGFNTIRTQFVTWVQPNGHIANPTTPVASGRKYKIELESREGFRFIPDPDPTIWHYAASLKIEHH
jgi:hypothetical protein